MNESLRHKRPTPDWLTLVNNMSACEGCGVIAGKCLCETIAEIRQSKPTPIPHITSAMNTAMRWYCYSDEYCTYDGKLHFSCAGHGDTAIEAYEDWLESYLMLRWESDDQHN